MATAERIYIDNEFLPTAEVTVQRHIPGAGSAQGLFRDTKELAVFAAGLGYQLGKKREVQKNGREIKLSAISNVEFGGREVLDAIALADTKDLSILGEDQAQRRATILEHYMNGGLEYLQALDWEDSTPLEFIVNVIRMRHGSDHGLSEVMNLASKRG